MNAKATTKSTAKAVAAIAAPAGITVDAPARRAIEGIAQQGRKVQVFGQFRNGRLQLDPSSVAELERRGGKFVFVAVNAPFDPVAAT